MRRRDFLLSIPFLPSTAFAADGLLLDDPSGDLIAGDPPTSGLLLDASIAAATSPRKKVILYKPNFHCPACIAAERGLKDDRIELVTTQDRPRFFDGKSFPVVHWGPGQDWFEGWPGREAALQRIFGDPPKPAASVPAARRSGDWTWPGDLSRHLCEAHGYCGAAIPATQRGRIDLHNQLHESNRPTTSSRRGSFLFWEW